MINFGINQPFYTRTSTLPGLRFGQSQNPLPEPDDFPEEDIFESQDALDEMGLAEAEEPVEEVVIERPMSHRFGGILQGHEILRTLGWELLEKGDFQSQRKKQWINAFVGGEVDRYKQNKKRYLQDNELTDKIPAFVFERRCRSGLKAALKLFEELGWIKTSRFLGVSTFSLTQDGQEWAKLACDALDTEQFDDYFEHCLQEAALEEAAALENERNRK